MANRDSIMKRAATLPFGYNAAILIRPDRDLGVGPISIPGYEIERELGVGGMARVYLAIQSSLERRVALKVMAPALAADASFSKRFLREARTIAALTHPHIVAVYEVGVTTDHLHYFSMQFLPGGDFAQRMRKGVEQAEIVRVLCGIGKALGFAHQQGVVHRDVTPGNIMFDAADTPLLTDFGIARALSGSTRITSTGVSIGTSNYMSPEQARGGDVDARSDLYSLGALTFEALTGHPPYQGPDGFAVAYAHVFEPIPRLPADIRHWQAFIDKALAKDPRDRFASADEFIAGLQSVELSPAAGALLPLPTGDALPAPVHSTTTMIENLARQVGPAEGSRLPGFPWGRYVLILVLVGGLSAIGYGLWQRPQTPAPAPLPSVATPVTPPGTGAAVATVAPSQPTPAPGVLDEPIPGEPELASPTSPEFDPDASSSDYVHPPAADFGPPTPAQRVGVFLELGQALLRMQRLQLPAEANATLFFARVLALEPTNETARAGLSAVVDAYLALADADLDAGRVGEGKERLDRARQVAATPGLDTRALVARIDARWNQRVDALRETARVALAEWRGNDAEAAIERALALVPGDAELTRWLREAKSIGKPGYRFRDAAGLPELVIVGGGSAMLTGARRGGDLKVSIGTPFAAGVREISVGEFKRFVEATKHVVTRESCRNREGFFSASKDRTWRAPGIAQSDDHPVVCVGFDDASAYTRWLSQSSGKRYRLLTEAEWQFLASQLKSRPCATGNRADQAYRKAEGGSGAQACDDGFAATSPGGRFEATAAGLYDMEGNVREWVADCDNDSHAGRTPDQSARNSGDCSQRIIMGSAWHSDNGEPAVISRRGERRSWLSNTVGFRVARELASASAAPR
jgi:serine/threonine protein kinase/formylglycine-generating enzyme required for sulfatase activity